MAGILQRLTTPFGGQVATRPLGPSALPGNTQQAPSTGAPMAQPKMVSNLGIKAFSPMDNVKSSVPALPAQHQSAIQQNNPATGQNTGLPKTGPSDPSIAANGTANNIPTPTQSSTPSGILNTLVGTSQGQAPLSPVVQQAMDKYNALAAQSAAIGTQGAASEAGQRTTGTSPVASGNAAVTAQTVAAQQGALGQQEQAALTAGGLGVNAQATQQSGLISALGASQQTAQLPYNTQNVYTATGQPVVQGSGGAGATDPHSQIQNFAQQLASGKSGIGYTAAYNQLAQAYGSAIANQLLGAVQGINPGFNVNASDAQAAATSSNVQTTGTAATSAANTAYNNAVQAVSKATGQYTAATGVAQNLTDTLNSWSQNGLLTNVNEGLNKIAGLTSSPQYSQFLAAITNAQAAYTAAFQTAGITPTQSTQNALQELNPNSSATAIMASLNQLSTDLHAATIVPSYQQQTTYGQQLGINH